MNEETDSGRVLSDQAIRERSQSPQYPPAGECPSRDEDAAILLMADCVRAGEHMRKAWDRASWAIRDSARSSAFLTDAAAHASEAKRILDATPAIAIEARSDATETGAAKGESAAIAQPSAESQQ